MSKRRITIVTTQLMGLDHAGGVAAATAHLALALARDHGVDILYTQEQERPPVDPDWAGVFAGAGVSVRRLPASDAPVDPPYFARLRAVEVALRADPPDVVVAHDYGAPAYIALRLRQLGLAFANTLFVVYCHGTGRWLKDATGNPRISAEMLAHGRLEQAAVELADIVLSPSAYMVAWMRGQGWRLPETRVVPLVTRATALGEHPRGADAQRPVERLAFFGGLHAFKGIELFVRALNALEPESLAGVELEFVGGATKNWDPQRVTALITERTKQALRGLSFETELGQQEALARLSRPGTLAVMPSLAENSPNVVYECLDARIPFLASAAGGIGELVAPEDRARVLFPPTVEGVSAALRRALADGEALRPVRASFEGADVLRAWGDVLATEPRSIARGHQEPPVDVVVLADGDADACASALSAQRYERLNVIRAATREEGLRASNAKWVIFLEGGDVPRPEFVEVLVQAQAASAADAVSCAVVHDGREHVFAGEPGGPGVLSNGYGTAALVRRSLVGDLGAGWPEADDPDWPLLARLSAAGGRVVSVPLPLLSRERAPGRLERDPRAALLVTEALEGALPDQFRLLARLAVGLAAAVPELSPPPGSRTLRLGSLLRRLGGEARSKARGAAQRAR